MRVIRDVKINLKKTREICTTEKSLKFIIIMANCFALLPVPGSTSLKQVHHFRWKLLKLFYSLAMTAASFYTLIAGMIYLTHRSTFYLIAEYLFCINWTVCLLVFIRLAGRWPTLMYKWRKIDKIMDKKYGKPEGLNKTILVITIVLMALAILEHGLAILSYIAYCTDVYGSFDISWFHIKCFPNFFASDSYSGLVGIAIQVVSIYATFTWTYNDLFIIAVSTALAVRFRQIRLFLLQNQNKSLAIEFWRDIREDYVRLSTFCLYLDNCITLNILTSFASNLISVLVKLFGSLNTFEGFVQRGYFVFSFAFLLFRTIAVSIYAAWVNDESKEPISVLCSVPSSLYNREVRRLLEQISFDNVALTGSRMYKVTKGLILNVAGAIVTYELVLIQFSNMYYTNNTT